MGTSPLRRPREVLREHDVAREQILEIAFFLARHDLIAKW
jgi:hypothetical protein